MNGRLLFVLTVLLTHSVHSQEVAGQTTSVIEISANPELLKKWTDSGERVTISGCYEGRFSKQFRLQKLPVTFRPGRNVVLPADVEAGQRVVVTGRLKSTGSRYEMAAERIAVGDSDVERIRNAIRRLPSDQPTAGFDLAADFQANADFYDDGALYAELDRLRENAFRDARVQSKDSFAELTRLADMAVRLKLEERSIEEVRFEAVHALVRSPGATTKQRLDAIRKLPGWDVVNSFLDPAAERKFELDPVESYRKAPSERRRRMHRKVFRQVMVPEIVGGIKEDGSNADDIAERLKRELPEQTREIDAARKQYIGFRLSRISKLGRSGVSELIGLLEDAGRGNESRATLDKWLEAQSKRLDVSKLDEQISLADEYLFAAERWKHSSHRDRGVELLKSAWLKMRDVAPEEAAVIYDRLRQSGWEWLRDRWMTTAEIASLPRDDMALAMREGRVVVGMKAPQVAALLGGEPSRVIRVASARSIHEIWVFGERGGTAIVVHVTRGRFEGKEAGVVTFVGKQSR